MSLGSLYDDDPTSVQLTSACLTPDEAMKLLDLGATFDTVVLVNGAGAALASRFVPDAAADAELRARIEHVAIADDEGQPVEKIHLAITTLPSSAHFFNGGG